MKIRQPTVRKYGLIFNNIIENNLLRDYNFWHCSIEGSGETHFKNLLAIYWRKVHTVWANTIQMLTKLYMKLSVTKQFKLSEDAVVFQGRKQMKIWNEIKND